jgi:hypothetical protein
MASQLEQLLANLEADVKRVEQTQTDMRKHGPSKFVGDGADPEFAARSRPPRQPQGPPGPLRERDRRRRQGTRAPSHLDAQEAESGVSLTRLT